MKNSLIQLQVFYEIAMSIGNSLDINKMLQESLTAYLKKLNCSAGAVFWLETLPEGVCRFVPVYSIPREIKRNPTCRHALEHIPQELSPSRLPQFLLKLPINGQWKGTSFYHIMELVDFGLLLLVKSSTDLELSVLQSLNKLNEKLARSCIACIQNEKVKQANEQLENEIHQRQQMEEVLLKAQKLEAIGVLAGGVAHDFNNLLAVILGNASMAKMESEPENGIVDLLNEIEKATLRAVDLTQKFLTFSSGGTPMRKPLSMKKLIDNVVSLECSGSNIVCDCSLPADLWKVDGDEGQVRQFFYNVIENAKEAMPWGGNIEIKAENIKVNAGKRKGIESAMSISPGSYVKIVIKDNGRGIPKGDLPNVFDPYYSTKQRGTAKGMGLGLTVAYSILAKHGGYLHIESECGKGTEVYVYLPAIPDKAAEKKERSRADTGAGKRILVMDDEEMVLNISNQMLKRLGYDVGLAKNGEEAVELYQQALISGQRFDVLILDLTVKGGMNGEDAIKQLLQIDPEVKAIVISGYATNPVMSDFESYGFKAALTKPFMWSQLKDVLKKLLEVEV
ncbi:MAG: response regulator [Candidatus Aminicenantes bacterium]|nr:response regulator [Candidatus Aminicenantes bacterium]NIM84897.1 response regulator [Candidatus Aminicenantes bacterium]NIN24408.1 response regulator [Candidatus Aminicenantes bacterium]NIN48172.1 response regulator [Candidatus Aminicenantes bacterium]NIN91075.1 response regulator [Candidatus Aminicenantes bacterium]